MSWDARKLEDLGTFDSIISLHVCTIDEKWIRGLNFFSYFVLFVSVEKIMINDNVECVLGDNLYNTHTCTILIIAHIQASMYVVYTLHTLIINLTVVF